MKLLQYQLLKIFLNLAISEAQRNIFVSFVSLIAENLAFIEISCHFHSANQV
jgi:hypothetical protein